MHVGLGRSWQREDSAFDALCCDGATLTRAHVLRTKFDGHLLANVLGIETWTCMNT